MRLAVVLLLLLLGGLLASYGRGYTAAVLGVFLLLISALTYRLYARDKAAAIAGRWRVAENTLHTLALCGGWPGALLAQQRLRHKTQKRSFRLLFWLTVSVNSAALLWLHSAEGNRLLQVLSQQAQAAALSHTSSATATTAVVALTSMRPRIAWP